MNAKAPVFALLTTVAACLCARPAAADDVTHSTRIEKNQVFVDVENGTVKEVVLTAPVLDVAPLAAIEIRYMDGTKARRNCHIKKEGTSWKVETVDPV